MDPYSQENIFGVFVQKKKYHVNFLIVIIYIQVQGYFPKVQYLTLPINNV